MSGKLCSNRAPGFRLPESNPPACGAAGFDLSLEQPAARMRLANVIAAAMLRCLGFMNPPAVTKTKKPGAGGAPVGLETTPSTETDNKKNSLTRWPWAAGAVLPRSFPGFRDDSHTNRQTDEAK